MPYGVPSNSTALCHLRPPGTPGTPKKAVQIGYKNEGGLPKKSGGMFFGQQHDIKIQPHITVTRNKRQTTNNMTELVYHDGHYHRVQTRHGRQHHQGGLWQKTYEAWDQVLYGIGSAYYKLFGR
ncbi:hypothetical protein EDB81DRAFT_757881 [Dactylonectria macrodidyma]|uniref:Uncharacterized protein n=1 Tax=Dactylonectria macrodidyma TaxID=307937 RepID=A0A9P9F557_9HYPO|nr:hypothetical protein EDB81DRAFT_757881 [Dactylonectria macrodidyma]